jgi:hypothetical protein
VLAVVFGRFLGVLILVPGRYLIKRFAPGFSFLVFGSWALLIRALLVRALLVRALLVLGIASQGVPSFLVRAFLVRVFLVLGVPSPGHCWSWSLLVVVLEVLD